MHYIKCTKYFVGYFPTQMARNLFTLQNLSKIITKFNLKINKKSPKL